MKPFARIWIAMGCLLIFESLHLRVLAADNSAGYIGLTIEDRETPDAPLRIVNVSPGSQAEKASVIAPAYLLTVNGTNVTQTAKEDALRMLRGHIGARVEFETANFDRQKTNKYKVARAAMRFATNLAASWNARRSFLVTTNDVIVAATPSGDTATVQFLNFSPSDGGDEERFATATYRIRFGKDDGEVTTNTLKESYSVKRVGKVNFDQWLTARRDHAPEIKIGKAKLEWSYQSSKGGHLAFDTNSVSVTIKSGGQFPNSSN